QFNNQNNFV
nr:Chain A, Major prion protein [Myodes glareolus]